jgi:hypothetical protein
MNSYFLDKNEKEGGEHQVHLSTCLYLPDQSQLIHLGYFATCDDVLEAAKKHYPRIDGCSNCCKKIHEEHIMENH